MKAKLELNGKKYEVEIGDEVVEQIESKVWEPKEGEDVYWLDSSGNIVSRIFDSYYTDINDMGFIFQTREQAVKYCEWLTWIKSVRRWNVENGNVGIDAKNPLFVYFVSLSAKNKLAFRYGCYPVSSCLKFKDVTAGEKFIKDFGKKKIVNMMKLQQEVMEMA